MEIIFEALPDNEACIVTYIFAYFLLQKNKLNLKVTFQKLLHIPHLIQLSSSK